MTKDVFNPDNPFAALYQSRPEDRRLFGDAYRPPEQFEWAEERLVARFEPAPDGHKCEIHEVRLPAQCFRLVVRPSNYPAWSLAGGPGIEIGKLIFALAKAVSEGTVNLRLVAGTGNDVAITVNDAVDISQALGVSK